MNWLNYSKQRRSGHTLVELIAATVASVVLLAGLAAVTMIGAQVAYSPSAAEKRTHAAEVVNQIAEELRYATIIVQQTPRILEFVVADRGGDGAAERIRYEWSGTPGEPLYKNVNSSGAVPILESVAFFGHGWRLKSTTSAFRTTLESAESVLVSNATSPGGSEQNIDLANHTAQWINPAAFAAVPAGAVSWNATKVDFYARQTGANSDTVFLHLRAAGEPNHGPTSNSLGQITIPVSTLTGNLGWNPAVFSSPVRDLPLHRRFNLVWSANSASTAARLLVNDTASSGVLHSSDAGGSWQFVPSRQIYYRLHGTYNVPGPTYDVSRHQVSHVQLILRASEKSHARIDAGVPLVNLPELLTSHWRAEFDRDPTAIDFNGDGIADWTLAGGGAFDTTKLTNGNWRATGALETRPLNDFTRNTIVEVACRNTSLGGNGAVVRINADRQGGLYAPLLVYVQRRSDGTQSLTLLGKPSDAATTALFTRNKLPDDFVRFRLTIVPQHDIVNLQINGEDQGTFVYPTYAPSSSTDRFLTLYADSSAEFDYVDVRVQ